MIVFVGCGNKQESPQDNVPYYMQEHGAVQYIDPYYEQLLKEYFDEHARTAEPSRLIDSNIGGIQFQYTIKDYIQESESVKDADSYYKQLLQEYFKEHTEIPESESLKEYIYSIIRDYNLHPNEISIIQDEAHPNEKVITTYDNQSYTLYYSNTLVQKIKDSISDVKDDKYPYEAIITYPNGDTKTAYFNYIPSSIKDYYNNLQKERETGVKMK